jgi:hypothetical protein
VDPQAQGVAAGVGHFARGLAQPGPVDALAHVVREGEPADVEAARLQLLTVVLDAKR